MKNRGVTLKGMNKSIGGALAAAAAILILHPVPVHAQNHPVTAPAGQKLTLPAESIVINRRGAYPLTIKRPRGPFLLWIENRLPGHEESFSLQADQPGAQATIALETHGDKPTDQVVLNLDPGKYRLKLKGQPQLSVSIEITN